MGGSEKPAARRRWGLSAALAACLWIAAVPAMAGAATTRVVAPGAARETLPCNAATPCNYEGAITKSSPGDTVQFESGEYDWSGAHNVNIQVPSEVTLEPAPGATRPVIKQVGKYPICNCATLALEGADVVDGLEIYQASAGSGQGSAIEAPQGALIEHSILIGAGTGMYYYKGAPAEPAQGVRDSLVLAEDGIGIKMVASATVNLDGDTVIARGAESVALLASSSPGVLETFNATDTITRGGLYDVAAESSASQPATVNLHYSDARTAKEHVQGTEAHVNDIDHPTHGEPLFVSATDFHEAPGSPTIDAGIADSLTGPLDLEGATRIFGSAQDIGAYESHAVPVVLSSPAPTTTKPAPTTTKPAPAVTPAPLDSALRLSHSRFRAAAKGATTSATRLAVGTTITYTDSEAATTTFTVLATVPGVRSGRACVAPPRHRRHGHRYTACKRQLSVGAFTHADSAGANSLHFSGRLHGRPLAALTYRLLATPRNGQGQLGPAVAASFTISR
jgi:plastocyanin